MAANALEFVGGDGEYRSAGDDRDASLIKHADSSPRASVHLKAIILTTSSVGLSVLVYPETVGKSGLSLWLRLLFLAITFNYLACYLLIQSAAKVGVTSTDEIYLRVFGRSKYLITLLKAVVELGTVASCMLLVNSVLQGFAWLRPDPTGTAPELDLVRYVARLLIINLLLHLVLRRHSLRDLEVVSLCVAVGVLAFTFLSLVRGLWSEVRLGSLFFSNYAHVSDTFSVLLIGFMSQDHIIDVFANLRTHRKRGMLRALNIQTAFLACFYCCVAVFGFASFQGSIEGLMAGEAGVVQRHPAVVVMNTLLGALVVHSNAKLLMKARRGAQAWFESYGLFTAFQCRTAAIIATQTTVTAAIMALEFFQVSFEALLEVLSKYLATVLCLLVPMVIYGKVFGKGSGYFAAVGGWFLLLMVLLNTEHVAAFWTHLTA